MIARLLAQLFGTANERHVKRLRSVVEKINYLEPRIKALSDEQLTAKTIEFRQELAQGKTLDDILPEAFAVVRETAFRKLGQRHYDVQLMGGIVLHEGKIAEMKTGEGKTLTATLPLYLNALTGKGAHLVTVNDYLARRDAEWMSPVYKHLGLTIGVIQNAMHDHERKNVYACDIVYGTNNELGFDYLRDNLKFRLEDYVQRELNFAIVDEVDSILIDEARTPLIISGSADESSKLYTDVDRVVARLQKVQDYEVDEKDRAVYLTESGVDKIEAAFGIKNLYAVEHIKLLHHATQALRAHAIYKRDVDYVVRDGQILIVDEFTGRILPGRRYSDGMHQAIEAKEQVKIERESQTLASITLQNFFRLYKKLSGMTGTAMTEAEEFYKIYKLEVVSIPTHRPLIREDKTDLIFLSENSKYKMIVQDVKERHAKGQPVLIGTVSIESSERLSNALRAHGIPHDVLNAKQHEREADIVAYAGEPGRVTIATNMAGRGTDIKLVGSSRDAGGLYILGTERHESRRIDNQLRGRSGRQGDPGESRFYISLEDDLIRRFAGDSIKRNMERFGMTEDEVIEGRLITRTIEQSQEKVEKRNFDVRKNLIEYDDVLNQQRIVIYKYRRSLLEGFDVIVELVRDLIAGVVEDIVGAVTPDRTMNNDLYARIMEAVVKLTGIPEAEFDAQSISRAHADVVIKDLINVLLLRYDLMTHRAEHQNPEVAERMKMLQEAQKWALLETIDQAWRQHMLNLESLKEGIGLRGFGQKNPLIEYKREAFAMFEDMMRNVRWEMVFHIFHLNIDKFDAHALEHRREQELEQLHMAGAAEPGTQEAAKPQHKQAVSADEAGRNEPCPCGSGKKYKKCCGK